MAYTNDAIGRAAEERNNQVARLSMMMDDPGTDPAALQAQRLQAAQATGAFYDATGTPAVNSQVPPGSQAPGRLQINFLMPDGSTAPYFAEPAELTGHASPHLQQILASGGLPIDPKTGAPLQKGPMVNGGNVWVNNQGQGVSLAQLVGMTSTGTPTLAQVSAQTSIPAQTITPTDNPAQRSSVTSGSAQQNPGRPATRIVWQNPQTGQFETGLPDGSDPQHFNSQADLEAYMRQKGESDYVPVSDPNDALNIVRQYTGNSNYQGYTGANYQPPQIQPGSPASGGSFDQWFDQTYPGPDFQGDLQTHDIGSGTDFSSFGALAQPFDERFQSPQVTAPQPFTKPFSFTSADLLSDPSYEFRRDQGELGMERNAAARGVLQNGGTAKALDRYNQDYASTEFQNAYSRARDKYDLEAGNFRTNEAQRYGAEGDAWTRAMSEYAQRRDTFRTNGNDLFNRYATLAGLGQTAAGQTGAYGADFANSTGNIGLSTARTIGDITTNQANANASATLARGNNNNNVYSNIGRLPGQFLTLRQIGGY